MAANGVEFEIPRTWMGSVVLIFVLWAVIGTAGENSVKTSHHKILGMHSVRTGHIVNAAVVESSGLAPSRLSSDVLWTLNDSGNPPVLYALGLNGEDLGSFPVEGAENQDWEDLASFIWNHVAYLLIADTGDNREGRESCTLYVVKEPVIVNPDRQNPAPLPVSWRIDFRYADGPRDCEAVAVDTAHRQVLLLSKRTDPAVLYTLPLFPSTGTSMAVARVVADVPGMTWPTAMDLSSDGSQALVLTDDKVCLFRSSRPERGTSVFSSLPVCIDIPRMDQAEGACFAAGRTIFISSENRPAQLVHLHLP